MKTFLLFAVTVLAELNLRHKQAGVSAGLHIHSAAGPHCGLRESNHNAAGAWAARIEEWLGDLGVLKHS